MNAMTEMPAQFETFAAEAQKKMARSFEEISAFNHASVDAVMQSVTLSTKGVEEMNSELLAFSRRSMEESVAAAREVASAKSAIEAMQKQGDFAKAWVDGCMKQVVRMNEMMLAASRDAMEPLSARASAASEMAKGRSA